MSDLEETSLSQKNLPIFYHAKTLVSKTKNGMVHWNDMGSNVTRLFQQFQPEHYDLALNIDRQAMKFSGTVSVRGKKTGRPSQRLTFHQKELKVTSATITRHDKKGDQVFDVSRINNQNALNEVRLHAAEQLFPGEYTVTMEFRGDITRPMNGIYPCFFKHDGKEKTLIATQFESHHAREAFPCIDEPEAKATYDLTVETEAGETTLANTPVKTQATIKDRHTTTFETTPRMSSYLLAFVTGEMHGVTGETKDGILVRSWATVAQPVSHLEYGNKEAIKLLEFFSDYFQTPFPLPKFDQVALPDFEALAMENWGLVTFREIGLLADPKNRSLSGEQLITEVIAHELSHQWFGNLVTMRWWNDLWLNESFASVMENLAPDKLHPTWKQWEEFAVGRGMSASNRDIYKDVQPVALEVSHPDEISSLFDPAIVYAKGARLVRTLLNYIGEDAARAGLKQYFHDHAYKNTERTDLWKALSDASSQDVSALMTPWLIQSGQPMIRVKTSGSSLQLSQQRFLVDGEDKTTLWPIPLLASTPLEPSVMAKRTLTLPYDGKTMPILNADGAAHFIVNYEDEPAREQMRQHITKRSVNTLTRINLMNDMLLLSRIGEYDLVDLLAMVQLCSKEPRDAVWSMMARVIAQALSLTDGDETAEKQLRAYRRELTAYWYEKLGWEDKPDDEPNTKHLRSTALALSISGENQDALDHALEMFAKAGKVEKLPAEQRAMIAGVAVRFGKPEYIDQLLQEYVATHSSEVQSAIAAALCSTRDVATAKRLIEWGMGSNGPIRPQDVDHWFVYLMRNHRTRELAWQWLVDNWSRLQKETGGKQMEYFIWYSSGPLSTPEWQQRFTEFFTPKLKEPGSARNIKIAFGEIAGRVAWRNREEPAIKAWLKKL